MACIQKNITTGRKRVCAPDTSRQCLKPKPAIGRKTCSGAFYANPDVHGISRTFSIQVNATTAVSRCHSNHHLESGDLVRYCQENGTWTGLDPVCQVDVLMGRYHLATAIALVVVVTSLGFLAVSFIQRLIHELKMKEQQLEKMLYENVIMRKRQRASPFPSLSRKDMTDALKLRKCESFDKEFEERIRTLESIKGKIDEFVLNGEWLAICKQELNEILMLVKQNSVLKREKFAISSTKKRIKLLALKDRVEDFLSNISSSRYDKKSKTSKVSSYFYRSTKKQSSKATSKSSSAKASPTLSVYSVTSSLLDEIELQWNANTYESEEIDTGTKSSFASTSNEFSKHTY